MSVDDSYTYPDSGGVLVNRFGIQDAATLDVTVNRVTTARLFEIHAAPIPNQFTIEHLQSVHRHLFHDTFTWAGQIRTVGAQADGRGIPYCRPAYIQPELDRVFAELEQEHYLVGLTQPQFVERLSHTWGELTAVHPFRDGNTRSQSVWAGQLAANAGHPLNWDNINVDHLRAARLRAVTTSPDLLAKVLDKGTKTPPTRRMPGPPNFRPGLPTLFKSTSTVREAGSGGIERDIT